MTIVIISSFFALVLGGILGFDMGYKKACLIAKKKPQHPYADTHKRLEIEVSGMSPIEFTPIDGSYLQSYVVWALDKAGVLGVQVFPLGMLLDQKFKNSVRVEFIHTKETVRVSTKQIVSVLRNDTTETTRHVVDLALTLYPYSQYVKEHSRN